MAISAAAKLLVLDDFVNAGSGISLAVDPYVSLHTGDPGSTGANEASGGGYGRQQTAFSAASGDSVTNSAVVDFTSLAAAEYRAWGIWTAVTSGTFLWGGWLSSTAKLCIATAADLSGNTLQSPSHGSVNDDPVVFEAVEDIVTPTGITLGTRYFVLATTTDTFTISTTQDGSALDVTAVGAALARIIVPRTTSGSNGIRIAAGDIDLFL